MLNRFKILSVVGLLLLFGCNPKGTEGDGGLVQVDDEVLMDALALIDSKQISTFYTKASVNFQDSSRNVNFKTSIRSILDSIVNLDVKYAAIPIVNAVVTQDSLKVVNRRDKCRVLNSITALRDQFGMEFSLNDLEDVLLGRVLFFNKEKEYHQLEDDKAYVLSTHSKKEIKKLAKDGGDELVIRYFLAKEKTHLSQVIIESIADKAIIVLEYKGYEKVGEELLPTGLKIDIKIGDKKPIHFDMDYSKTRINEAEDIYFVIPEDYGDCTTN